MKKFIFIFALLSFITVCADGQTDSRRLSYTTYIVTGFSMNQPSYTPFNWQIVSHYHISQRFAIGAGSGLSVYEKLLIPLYASAQFYITKPRRLTPYLECHIGGSFATDREANGGFYLSPSIGAQFKVNRKFKLNLMAGYELQKLERTKKQEDPYFHTTFKEELSHHSITLKIGLTY